MLLASLVETSRRVAETSGRLEKVRQLAALLQSLPLEEIDIAVAFLSGSYRQSKLNIGYAALQAASEGGSATAPSLTLADVDAAFESIAGVAAGKGSTAERQRVLRELFSRATAEEQHFLFCLVVGELRQGAVEGLMLEAVARAAGVPVEQVRRARMMAGDLPSVARAALTGDTAALAGFTPGSFNRCIRCWPDRPTLRNWRSRSWARRRWSTSWMGPESRCTRQVIRWRYTPAG